MYSIVRARVISTKLGMSRKAEYYITAVFQHFLDVGILQFKYIIHGAICLFLNYLNERRANFVISVTSELHVLLGNMYVMCLFMVSANSPKDICMARS